MLGVEQSFNYLLSGDTTNIKFKKGAKGKYFNPDMLNEKNIDGYDIQLTVDIELQKILQELEIKGQHSNMLLR